MFEQPKGSHWNIDCGNSEYFHQFASEHPIGCNISGWSKRQWSDYSFNSQFLKETQQVMKLVDIITSAIAVFEMSVSKALDNSEIDEREIVMLQDLHIKVINELANVDRKWNRNPESSYKKIYRKG